MYSTTPNPHAIERAWRLASAYSHHWASSATPFQLALGRALLARACAQVASYSHRGLIAELAEPIVHLASPREREGYDLVPPDHYEVPDYVSPPLEPETPPTTPEECEALGALPTCTGCGISYGADEHGVHRSWTGTRRVVWEVYPDGATNVIIERPTPARADDSREGYAVLCASLEAQSSVARIYAPDEYRERHLEALAHALRSLSVTELEPGDEGASHAVEWLRAAWRRDAEVG